MNLIVYKVDMERLVQTIGMYNTVIRTLNMVTQCIFL